MPCHMQDSLSLCIIRIGNNRKLKRMKKNVLLLCIFIALTCMSILTACSNDDSNKAQSVDFYGMKVPVEIVSYNHLPTWVADAVTSGTYSKIFQGYYDDKTIYAFDSPLYSTSLIPFFYQDGTHFKSFSSIYELYDFLELTKGWKCIYYNEILN